MSADACAVLERYAAEGLDDVLAALEALADERVAGPEHSLARDGLAAELAVHFPDRDREPLLRELAVSGLASEHDGRVALRSDALAAVRAGLDRHAAAREVEWGARRLSQGDVLTAMAAYCRDELDDVQVEGEQRCGELVVRLRLRRRREQSRIEARNGFLFTDRLAAGPTMLLVDLGRLSEAVVAPFVREASLRESLALCDLDRLEKVNAVRSSAFVYFEWFLRDAYGVKLLPAAAFTQGLVNQGIISLGFG